MLGVEPLVGRVFSTDEEKRGDRVAVLSYGLWQKRFGGSAQALGSDLVMDGRRSRIIGIMPPQFQFPFKDTQAWEPITTHPYWAARDRISPRSNGTWYVLGRLKPHTTWAQAQTEMNTIARRLQAQHPDQGLAQMARTARHQYPRSSSHGDQRTKARRFFPLPIRRGTRAAPFSPPKEKDHDE